jgi:O-antigen/teichoic acid export membrane protein
LKIDNTVKIIATLASGNLFATCIGMISSIIQARFVEPSVLGYFNQFAILSTYLNFLNIGTIDFIYRKLPYLISTGERETAERYLSTCLAWILIAWGACSLLFSGLAAHALIRNDAPRMAGWLVQIVVVAGSLYGVYLGATYRIVHIFSRIAWVSVVQSIIGIPLLLGVYFAPYWGLCTRTAVMTLVLIFLLSRTCPLKVRPSFDLSVFKVAIRQGFPMFTIGYAQTSFQTALEYSIILHFLGNNSLGLYAFSYTVYSALMIIPLSFTQVYLPRISQCFGEEKSMRKCLKMTLAPTFFCFAVTLCLTGCFALLFGPIVSYFMPKYMDAVPVMKAFAIAVPVRVLFVPVLTFYAAGKNILYAVSVFSGFAFFGIAATASIHAGWGLVGIVLAVAFGDVGRTIVSYSLLGRAAAHEAYAERSAEMSLL